MNVTDKMKELYGNEVYFAALHADKAEVDRLEKEYQDAWDSGNGFTLNTMFKKRADDEQEAPVCAGQFYNELKKVVVKKWMRSYSREEIVTLCNLLFRGPENRYTCVRLVADLEMSVDDIAIEWNNLHQNEPHVYLSGPDIG